MCLKYCCMNGNQCSLWDLIWVCIVCEGLSVPILRVIMVVWKLHVSRHVDNCFYFRIHLHQKLLMMLSSQIISFKYENCTSVWFSPFWKGVCYKRNCSLSKQIFTLREDPFWEWDWHAVCGYFFFFYYFSSHMHQKLLMMLSHQQWNFVPKWGDSPDVRVRQLLICTLNRMNVSEMCHEKGLL